ncbi:MAG: hypothetical protein DRJ35_03810 [Thermoprotei archaeon]|nr:MAG: hypothetical protein DRJ35_03810 [Thermoprotei archaeon]
MIELSEYLLKELQRIPHIVSRQYSETRKTDAKLTQGIAIGSGDSFAAANTLFYLTKGSFIPLDPLDALVSDNISAKQLVALSVKGKTIKVVEATATFKKKGVETIAVTAFDNSPLAKTTDKVVKLTYSGGELPIGVGNYTAMITALAALTRHTIEGFHQAYRKALAHSLPESDLIVAVGEQEGYANAMFICLKLYETTCSPCRYYRLEQFLHAPIYSLPENTAVIVFQSSRSTQPHDIVQVLEQAGYQVISACFSEKPLPNLVGGTAYVARIAAFMAEKHGYTKPCFLAKRDILEPSTSMIYK